LVPGGPFFGIKFSHQFPHAFFRVFLEFNPVSAPNLDPFLHHFHIFGITFSTLVFASFLDRLFIDFCTPGTSEAMLLQW